MQIRYKNEMKKMQMKNVNEKEWKGAVCVCVKKERVEFEGQIKCRISE